MENPRRPRASPRSRTRLAAGAALLGALAVRSAAGDGATLEIYQGPDESRELALVALRAELDGRELPVAAPSPFADPAVPLYRGPIAPGTHEIRVTATYEGRSSVFTYVESYRFHMRGRLDLQVGPGDVVGVQGRVLDQAGFTVRWEDRFRYALRASGRRGPPPAAEARAVPPPPPAAPPPPAPPPSSCELGPVRFAFAKAALGAEARAALDGLAACLARSGESVRLVGHCDVRGPASYNLWLGEQRARAAARYLESRGVSPERIRTGSAGESQPLCAERTRSCHARNRRVEAAPVR